MPIGGCECLDPTRGPPCCARCFTEADVRIAPAVKNGKFVGQIFVCRACASVMADAEIEIKWCPPGYDSGEAPAIAA
jgi:hypothetical protein